MSDGAWPYPKGDSTVYGWLLKAVYDKRGLFRLRAR
jgi:hypothetical protein